MVRNVKNLKINLLAEYFNMEHKVRLFKFKYIAWILSNYWKLIMLAGALDIGHKSGYWKLSMLAGRTQKSRFCRHASVRHKVKILSTLAGMYILHVFWIMEYNTSHISYMWCDPAKGTRSRKMKFRKKGV